LPLETQADGSLSDVAGTSAADHDESGVIMMNAASVAMASRVVRQNGHGEENGVEHHVQLKGIRVDCADASSEGGLIAVEIEFLERFDGVVYSKGRHDDPNCM